MGGKSQTGESTNTHKPVPAPGMTSVPVTSSRTGAPLFDPMHGGRYDVPEDWSTGNE